MKVQAIQIKFGYHHVTVLVDRSKSVKQLALLNPTVEFELIGKAFEVSPRALTELRITTYLGFSIRVFVSKDYVEISKSLVKFFDRPVSIVIDGRSRATFDFMKGAIALVSGRHNALRSA